MPLSSNAPFNEFGQSMILRDIEQLWLSLNGIGTGSPGDGQTQDQSTGITQETGDGAGLPDLSQLATIAYVNAAIANIRGVFPLYLYASGTVTPSSGTFDASYSSQSGNMSVSGNVFTAPYNGIYTIVARYGTSMSGYTSGTGFDVGAIITPPYGVTNALCSLGTLSFTVGGVAPVFASRDANLTPVAVWTGFLNAGDTVTISNSVSNSAFLSASFNSLLISGIPCNP